LLLLLSVAALDGGWGSAAAALAEEGRRSAGQHLHGVARLTLVREGKALSVQLETPVFNLIGIEHEPATAAERAAWDDALSRLTRRDQPPVLPNRAARCSLVDVMVDDPFAPRDHGHAGDDQGHEDYQDHDGDGADAGDHDAEDHDADDHEHADVDVRYRFECDRDERLREVQVALFDEFPGVARLDAIYLDARHQAGATLTPDRSRFRW
jgi:hypothetical protein